MAGEVGGGGGGSGGGGSGVGRLILSGTGGGSKLRFGFGDKGGVGLGGVEVGTVCSTIEGTGIAAREDWLLRVCWITSDVFGKLGESGISEVRFKSPLSSPLRGHS